jgi:hypothetical protein
MMSAVCQQNPNRSVAILRFIRYKVRISSQERTEQMSERKRSPAHPIIDLPEAIGLIEKLYRADRTHPVDRSVAATNIGYSGLTGRSMGVLSTLRQYGLIDTMNDSQVKVSNLSKHILFPEDEREKRQNLVKAALSPKLFQDIHEKYGGSLPSDGSLIAFLVRQGFFDTAAQTVVRVLRSTFDYAGVGKFPPEPEGIEEETEDEAEEDPMAENPRQAPPQAQSVPAVLSSGTVATPEGVHREVFAVDEGEVTLTWPKEMSQESYQDIEDWLAILLRKMKRASAIQK